jgi:hypothetical protein
VLGATAELLESRPEPGIRALYAGGSATTKVPGQCEWAAIGAPDQWVAAAAGAINAWSGATTDVPGTPEFAAVGVLGERDGTAGSPTVDGVSDLLHDAKPIAHTVSASQDARRKQSRLICSSANREVRITLSRSWVVEGVPLRPSHDVRGGLFFMFSDSGSVPTPTCIYRPEIRRFT